MNRFKKAVKQDAKLRLAIVGPSGSGKTYTALAVGTALAGKGGVALVDTESGSASKYADIFDFDVAEMNAPYAVEKYISIINEADQAGYDVLIIDSLSHGWSGAGGLLDYIDEAAKRIKGNSFAAWKEGTPLYNKLVTTIIESNLHIIGTMRAKTEYILTENKKGYTTPKKVGMGAIQRDGLEYEFDVVFEMDIDNNAIVTKTRCSALANRAITQPGKDVADTLREWLQGTPPDNLDDVGDSLPYTDTQHESGPGNASGFATGTPQRTQTPPQPRNGNGAQTRKPAQNGAQKPDSTAQADGWNDKWQAAKDYANASTWARQFIGTKFNHENHVNAAWQQLFKDNEAHMPDNAPTFLAAWRDYVRNHEPAAEKQPA